MRGSSAQRQFRVSCSCAGTVLAVAVVMDGCRPLVLAIALAGACAQGSAGPRGAEQRLQVSFEGNRQLSNKTLLAGLGLHRVQQRNGAADPYLIQVDADRIRGEYLRK